MVPNSKPRISYGDLMDRISTMDSSMTFRDVYPLIIVGIRGYYKEDMGASGKNDRDIYDDAIFVVSEGVTASYNGNTDPSYYRKGIATLCPGVWKSYRFDNHRGKYLALCQRSGVVTVRRDLAGGGFKEDTGMFGINIHKGSRNTTSSLGCQTIYPTQWDSFINLAVDQAKRLFGDKWKKTTIPYILMEN